MSGQICKELCKQLDLPRPYATSSLNKNCSAPRTDSAMHMMDATIAIRGLGFYTAADKQTGNAHTTFVIELVTAGENNERSWKIYRRFRQFDNLRQSVRKYLQVENLQLPRFPDSDWTLKSNLETQAEKLETRMNSLMQWLQDIVPMVQRLKQQKIVEQHHCTFSPEHWANSVYGKALAVINCFLFSAVNVPMLPFSAVGATTAVVSVLPGYALVGAQVSVGVHCAESGGELGLQLLVSRIQVQQLSQICINTDRCLTLSALGSYPPSFIRWILSTSTHTPGPMGKSSVQLCRACRHVSAAGSPLILRSCRRGCDCCVSIAGPSSMPPSIL
jgi:hypothetical protein